MEFTEFSVRNDKSFFPPELSNETRTFVSQDDYNESVASTKAGSIQNPPLKIRDTGKEPGTGLDPYCFFFYQLAPVVDRYTWHATYREWTGSAGTDRNIISNWDELWYRTAQTMRGLAPSVEKSNDIHEMNKKPIFDLLNHAEKELVEEGADQSENSL